MREEYIKQVESKLAVSSKQKKEVIRDLNGVFASALERGCWKLAATNRKIPLQRCQHQSEIIGDR